jgi:hypothetical protein
LPMQAARTSIKLSEKLRNTRAPAEKPNGE